MIAKIDLFPIGEAANFSCRIGSSREISRKPTDEQRIHDLAKGLQAHFEQDTPYTPLSGWLHLARRLAEVMRSADAESKGSRHPAGEV